MSRADAGAVHDWIAAQFGSPSSQGSARHGNNLGVQYSGSRRWEGPTPAEGWPGYYGEFGLQRGDARHVLRMGANVGGNDDPYLVFLLDEFETPVFEYHLQGHRIHAVPNGWWMTHIKHIGLGRGGGSISQQRVLDTTLRNAPRLRTGGVVDLGGVLRTSGDPVHGVAGFLYRVLDFVLVRNALRQAHLEGRRDP